jgi:hypothetical protein
MDRPLGHQLGDDDTAPGDRDDRRGKDPGVRNASLRPDHWFARVRADSGSGEHHIRAEERL